MSFNVLSKSISLVCSGVLAAAMLAGCTAPQNSATSEQKANREYMSEVNQKVDSLSDKLSDFKDAVSRNDVVNMKTTAANAGKVLDDLAAVEAPDELADIQSNYIEGTKALETALNAYVDLYTEIDSATDANPFDWSTYDARVATIQQQYDQGVAALKAGDEAAAEKQ